MNKHLKISDPEILEATYQCYARPQTAKPIPIWMECASFRRGCKENARGVLQKTENFVNTRFLDELEKEGFYKQLSK